MTQSKDDRARVQCPHGREWFLGNCSGSNSSVVWRDFQSCDCVSHSGGCTERPYTRDSAIAALALLKIQGELG